MEGYYQVMSLLVDIYRSAVGITTLTLVDEQWGELLQEMPLEGRVVIPRMLIEAKLKAENPRVCHMLLGGLLNAHTVFMMNAQEWAMEPALNRPLQHKLDGPLLTDANYTTMQSRVQLCRKSWSRVAELLKDSQPDWGIMKPSKHLNMELGGLAAFLTLQSGESTEDSHWEKCRSLSGLLIIPFLLQ